MTCGGLGEEPGGLEQKLGDSRPGPPWRSLGTWNLAASGSWGGSLGPFSGGVEVFEGICCTMINYNNNKEPYGIEQLNRAQEHALPVYAGQHCSVGYRLAESNNMSRTAAS